MKFGHALCVACAGVWACSSPATESGVVDDGPAQGGPVAGPAAAPSAGTPADGQTPDEAVPAMDTASPTGTTPTSPTSPTSGVALDEDGVAPGSRVRRVQLEDFDRIVSDLLMLEASVSDAFPEDAPTLHGYLENAKLRVSDRLSTELTLAAESLAQAVRNNPGAYDALTGCFGNFDAACRDRFVDDFVSRAYRRPATETERSAYTALFDRGQEVVQSGDAFADGVQVVIEAVLQSPKFIYRIEQGSATQAAAGIPLTDHEIASRLSFMLWGTMPDEELRAVADAGMLSSADQIAEQARRMVESPRVGDKVLDFHERWLQMNALAGVSKDQDLFAPFSPELVDAMQEELRLFVNEVTLNQGGGIQELLTAPFGYSNSLLDSVYQSGGNSADLSRVEYGADSPRLGLLTQAAFLSGHSSSSATTSPILRGIFILDRLLCLQVPPPPANAAATEPPPPDVPPVTTRDMFTWKTSMVECKGCHDLINPIGFAFEGFDAIGRHRTMENGAPVDTTGTVRVSEAVDVADAKELINYIATLDSTRECYARHLLEYSYGRASVEVDEKNLAMLSNELSHGTKAALVALTSGVSFSHLPE